MVDNDELFLKLYSFFIFLYTAWKIRKWRINYDHIDESRQSFHVDGGDDDQKNDAATTRQTLTNCCNSQPPSSSHQFSSCSPHLVEDEDNETTTRSIIENYRFPSTSFSSSRFSTFPCSLASVPRLSDSNSVRSRRRILIMDELDEEQRDVMRHFDSVIREMDDLRIKENQQSIPNLPSAETPVFVPPPPPPTENSIMGSQPVPRLANLEKSSPSDEFGFNLHAERNRGHFIGTVDAGGIGERAGLQMGQRIVGVNGLLIYPNTPHKEVVALIKKSPLSTTLLVAPEDVDRWYRDHGAEYSFQNAERYGEQAENHHENHHTSRHGTVSHHENVPNKTNGFEVSTNVPALNPHSIQVNEERETTRTTLTTKTETTSVNSYQYKGDAYNPYSAVGNDSDDLLAQVFSQVNVPVLNVQDNVVVTSHTREISEDVTSSASSLSSHRESAVDVPASHQYVPSYVSAQTQQTQYNHHESHQSHQQPSPISNGSSHGYNGGSTSGYEDDDIYHLSAKEARERLRQKHIKPHLRDMSLNEKYQLVSNM